MTENVSSQNHLLGSYSFVSSQGIRIIGSDLYSAGFWNYLREDITVALMQKRPLKIDLTMIQVAKEPEEDDDWANHVTFLLGKIINQCLGSENLAIGALEWSSLMAEAQTWKDTLPASYTALSPPPGSSHSNFPTLWLLNGWHSEFLPSPPTRCLLLEYL